MERRLGQRGEHPVPADHGRIGREAQPFAQAFGNAVLSLRELSFDTSLQGDRRLGERASLRLGVRYQGTNHSRDFLRIEPTVNLQYRLTPSTFLSAGSQLTFADFTDYERLLRNDGSRHETELTISSPAFPDPFQGATVEIGGDTASLWLLSPDYHSPYTFSPQVSIRQDLSRVRATAPPSTSTTTSSACATASRSGCSRSTRNRVWPREPPSGPCPPSTPSTSTVGSSNPPWPEGYP